jgi:hypothetical protein
MLAVMAGFSAWTAAAQETYSWRYYRVGNTGIQGDYNQAVWVGPDGDPYIAGYDPIFEEGGFSKFIQGENRATGSTGSTSGGIAVLTVQRPTTAVSPGAAPVVRLTLAQNQPNPFFAETQIRFGLPRAAHARLDIYDISGRLVRRLVDGTLPAGDHSVDWDGRSNGVTSMASGVYLYRLEAGGEAVERRMLILH